MFIETALYVALTSAYADQLKEIIRAYAGVRAMYKAETSSLETNIIKLHC